MPNKPRSETDKNEKTGCISLGGGYFTYCLPPTSFRFHLTMNALALGYVIPAIRALLGTCTC